MQRLPKRTLTEEQATELSRVTTLVRGPVSIVFADLLTSTDDPVVQPGLSVAGTTCPADVREDVGAR